MKNVKICKSQSSISSLEIEYTLKDEIGSHTPYSLSSEESIEIFCR